MDYSPELAAALHRQGQSMTKPRQVVFAALQNQEPLTMHELVERCSSIDRASVYRTIALFEELGIVQRLQVGWKYRIELSDQFTAHHHHATCLRCGKSLNLAENSQLEALLHTLANSRHFTLMKHQIELQGYCAECQSKRT